MDIEGFNPALQRAFAWIGPAFTVIFLAGFLISGLFPPTDPLASSQEIARHFVDHAGAIRVGSVLMAVGLSLFAPWGAAIAMWTRREERGYPLLTYTQLLALAACCALLMLLALVWAAGAYRPEDTDPDITRAYNDVAWFLFLFTWPPFTLWTGSAGLAMLLDRRPTPTFPRWAGYLSLWCALLLVPAGTMAFFKSGPMAYDGIIAFYIPLIIFFIWVVGVTWAMLRHIARLERQATGHPEPDLVAG
jgi:hypothetical protein